MRRKIVEESVLFISILKWLSLATCIGIIVDFSTVSLAFSIMREKSFLGLYRGASRD